MIQKFEMLILPSFELFEDISAPSFQCQIYDLLLRIMSEASILVSNLVGQLLTLLDYCVWIYNYSKPLFLATLADALHRPHRWINWIRQL